MRLAGLGVDSLGGGFPPPTLSPQGLKTLYQNFIRSCIWTVNDSTNKMYLIVIFLSRFRIVVGAFFHEKAFLTNMEMSFFGSRENQLTKYQLLL